MNQEDVSLKQNKSAISQTQPTYGIEYFHIYTDEKIGDIHNASLGYVKQLENVWELDRHRILMIDNYNPEEHVTSADEIIEYLTENDMKPDFWAYEADLLDNAQLLLDSITSNKLKKSYVRYIEQHNKFPCSLLTASWYLTRLGALPHESIIKCIDQDVYEPVSRLVNILPQDYKDVEARALTIIKKSEHSEFVDAVQDLFYPMSAGRAISLW